MTESWKRISYLAKDVLAILTRIVLGLIIAPLLIALYPVCWIRLRLTSLIYCNKNRTLLSGSDAIPGLYLDHVNSMINCIILTEKQFSLDAMKELLISKVLNAKDTNNRPRFPRLTQYVHLCAGYLMQSEESNFDIDDHIRLYHGQPPNNEEQMKLLITDLCHNPLPSLKSGWESIVIPLEYSHSDVPKTCILFRVSHFMTDGISILRLIMEQMAGNHGAFQHVLKRMQEKFKPKFKNEFLNISVNLALGMYKNIFNQSNSSFGQVNQVFAKDKSRDGELSDTGYIDWTSAIKMDTIRCIRVATSTSVNDVLMSCMAGAFRKYFVKHGICPPDHLKTGLPISLHSPDDPVEMTNKVNAIEISMPTGDMDCLQRLKATKVEMDQLKCSPENITNPWFLKHCGNAFPYKITRRVSESFIIHALFSNVPGPTSKVAFNRNTIESVVLIQLPCLRIGFVVVVVTYSGNVTVAVSVDKARVSSREDLRQLLDDFVEEVQQLYNSVIGSPNKQPSTAMEKKMV